ncbi:MAG: hypothetical protein ACOH2H_01125 [Cypionkella sp.]
MPTFARVRILDWVMGGVAGAILGAVPSWWISNHFAGQSWSNELDKAKESAREVGRKEGFLQAQKAFKGTEEMQLQLMFPDIFRQFGQSKRDEGLALGREQGREDGELACGQNQYVSGKNDGLSEGAKSGYNRGLADCTTKASAAVDRLEMYVRDWGDYEQLVKSLADAAAAAEENPSDEKLQSTLLGIATAVAEASKQLRESMQAESLSFNSLATDLLGAVKNNNYPEMRNIGRALSLTLDTKRNLFLESKKEELSTFDSLLPK